MENIINTIIYDDCFNILPKIKKNSINLVITDPPYNISKPSNFKMREGDSKFGKVSLEFGEWDKDIDFDKLFSEFKRILKPGGTVIMFYDIWKCSILRESAMKNKFSQPRVCQWVKQNPVPINSKFNYLSNSIEFFFTFTKGRNSTFNSYYDKGIYNFSLCHGKERTQHPTQKPLELFKSIIIKHSNENDLILDTFGGSGTSAVASIETNRNFIIIENKEEYYNIIKNRIELKKIKI